MKRSEMVDEYISVLKQYNAAGSFDDHNRLANYLLEVTELMGMAPPMLEDKSFIMLDSGEMVYEVREWEDETN